MKAAALCREQKHGDLVLQVQRLRRRAANDWATALAEGRFPDLVELGDVAGELMRRTNRLGPAPKVRGLFVFCAMRGPKGGDGYGRLTCRALAGWYDDVWWGGTVDGALDLLADIGDARPEIAGEARVAGGLVRAMRESDAVDLAAREAGYCDPGLNSGIDTVTRDLGVAVWRYWEHLGRAGGCESPTAFGDPCFDCYGCTVEAQCPAGIGPVDYRRLGVQHWARMLSHRAMVTT